MLNRFLLVFFALGTVFISNYSMERNTSKPKQFEVISTTSVSPHVTHGEATWNSGAQNLEEILSEVTPPAIDQTDAYISERQSISFQPDSCSAEKLPDLLKSLELIDKKTFAHAIEHELFSLLSPADIQFSGGYSSENITHFLAESIVNAHVTSFNQQEVRPYSRKDILCACLYFEKTVAKMVESFTTFQEYFGNTQANVTFLLRIFAGACITAVKINLEPLYFITLYESLPFEFFTKEELLNKLFMQRTCLKLEAKFLDRFFKLTKSKPDPDMKKVFLSSEVVEFEFIPLAKRILLYSKK
jgi:hypothetical protein